MGEVPTEVGSDSDLEHELKSFGVAQHEIDVALHSHRQEAVQQFELWFEHIAVWTAFEASSTQWRVLAMGQAGFRYQGLDYAGCHAAMKGLRIRLSPEEWQDFRVLEAEATRLLNKELNKS